LKKSAIYGKIDIREIDIKGSGSSRREKMTRRQQLILFVLGLATVSICTVAFALTMSLCSNPRRFSTDRTSRARGRTCVSTYAHFHTYATPNPYEYARAYLDAVSNLYADSDPYSD
jgi:hypothetical protein